MYDMKMNGKYHDGNNNGKLFFKIRKNDDLPNFEEKKTNFLKKISDEMGLKIKQTEVNTKRPLYFDIYLGISLYQQI